MIVIVPAVIALHSYVFMFLWNLLITDIFSLRFINFWETLGLVAMAKLLLMTGHRGSKHSCHTNRDEHGKAGFKERMHDHFTSKYCCSEEKKEGNMEG